MALARARHGRLPTPQTLLVGRAEDIEAAKRLVEDGQLLTLTGPGGSGKTRLAIAVAERIAERFGDGTWFVALDAVYEAHLVVPEIITTLGLGSSAEAPLEQLIEHLRERSVLLVLDNVEQVIDAGDAIARVVRECRSVGILATSRIPLRVYGEQEFPVPALPVPGHERIDVARLGRIASVRLFEERARAAKPSFALTDANALDVADIVARLDGLPLAIELAAARVRMLAPAALRKRLDDRLGTLTGGGRDLPGRQQTLRGAIAWSHDLLDEPDRRLFARFGVFAGSATLAHIEAIAGPADEMGREIIDGVESLAGQSLLRVVESEEDEPRFTMLATIREFAKERLADSGEADRVHRRHAQVYLALAEERVLAFSAYDANNRGTGWFGPMGTEPAARSQGIGQVLLFHCLADMAAQGHHHATIPWVDPVDFYRRCAGAAVSRIFHRYEKVLST